MKRSLIYAGNPPGKRGVQAKGEAIFRYQLRPAAYDGAGQALLAVESQKKVEVEDPGFNQFNFWRVEPTAIIDDEP